MTLLYADTSALARAYLDDEPEHHELRRLLLEGGETVVTSELAQLELASAVTGAAAARRIRAPAKLLTAIDTDCSDDGHIVLLTFRPDRLLAPARRLVVEHTLRALDAVHLAVALVDCPVLAGGEETVFVTRDERQARAARRLGLIVL